MGNKQSASRGSAPSSPARVMGGGQPIPFNPSGASDGEPVAAQPSATSATMIQASVDGSALSGWGSGVDADGSGWGSGRGGGGAGSGGGRGACAGVGGGSTSMPAPARTACLDDFVMLKTVGRGSFGKVMMVRKKDDGRVYAMKALKKEQVLKRRQYEHTVAERRILENLDHPFIVSLRFAFQTEHK